MTSCIEKNVVIGGINVHVYSSITRGEPKLPVAALFLLHGRLGSARHVEWIVSSIFSSLADKPERRKRELIVLTFDHRNHGSRLVNRIANNAWQDAESNKNHAIDMYAIQTGTAADVSYLIDFLPAYLYPSAERTIDRWMVAGVSLGGHAAWIALRNDPRVQVGIPIIGCPDYLALMRHRAAESDITLAPPVWPHALEALIIRQDPALAACTALDYSNPFFNKRILVLAGGMDPLVPWSASRSFVQGLEVGPEGVKKIVIEPRAKHEVTRSMVAELSQFISQELLLVNGV